MSTYVSVGRNINGAPMHRDAWSKFKDATSAVVKVNIGNVVTEAEGFGEYEGETEQTYIVVSSASPDGAPLVRLEADLARLARTFGQESIALTIGRARFIKATEGE